MDGLKSYLDWMQQLAAAMPGQRAHGFPPMPSFPGWLAPGSASPPPGLDALRELLDTPAFGYGRVQQAKQQALVSAMLDHQQASARYQQLIAHAQVGGAERLQRKMAEPGFSGTPSLKAMYDLWVDAVEEAYAEIALSDEFREAYAAQANTQMRVRQLQQQQVEQWCREVGLPTRSEVATLGQRLQELRRELRRMQGSAGKASAPGARTAAKTAKPSAPSQPAVRARPKPAMKPEPPAKTPSRRAARKPR